MVWPIFDLQLFGGGANKQQNQADQYYQEQANAANQMLQNFNQYALPIMQKLDPVLMQTIMGGNSPLMTAAQAPVLAETARTINSLKTNPSGAVNPNALYQDMLLNGNQQAGLAADQTLGMSLQALQNILGMNFGGQQAGMHGLGSAGSGEANLGAQLNQQSNQWWQSLLGAAGTAAGAYYGGGVPSSVGKMSPNATVNTQGVAAFGGVPTAPLSNDYSFLTTNSSTPISSGNG